IVLNKFPQADSDGKPEWIISNGEKKARSLELVPSDKNGRWSNLLYHSKVTDGAPEWENVLADSVWKSEAKEPGRKVEFTCDALPDVIVTKTYTLDPHDYHVLLEVKCQLKKGKTAAAYRFQLAGTHGLRIEGEWYTNPTTLRNAVAIKVDGSDQLWQ